MCFLIKLAYFIKALSTTNIATNVKAKQTKNCIFGTCRITRHYLSSNKRLYLTEIK